MAATLRVAVSSTRATLASRVRTDTFAVGSAQSEAIRCATI